MGYTLTALVAAAFAIWAMVDISKSSLNKNQKMGWFAVAILIPIVGPIVYFFVGKY